MGAEDDVLLRIVEDVVEQRALTERLVSLRDRSDESAGALALDSVVGRISDQHVVVPLVLHPVGLNPFSADGVVEAADAGDALLGESVAEEDGDALLFSEVLGQVERHLQMTDSVGREGDLQCGGLTEGGLDARLACVALRLLKPLDQKGASSVGGIKH